MRQLKISNIILLLIVLTGCKEQLIETNSFNQADGIALIGEINQIDTVAVALVKTGNLITGETAEPIANALISLLNQNQEIISNFSFNTFKKWQTNLLPAIQAGEKYTINAQINGEQLSATTQIPLPIIARLVNTLMVDQSIYLDIEIENPNNLDAFCTVELLSQTVETNDNGESIIGKAYTSILINTEDKETDNYIYNELTAPYSKIFIHLEKNEKKILRINSAYIYDFNNKYCLWIKSLESDYYKYMYNSELQNNQYLNDISLLVQLNDNITNGIGFWGGCYKIIQPITLNIK